MTIRTFIWGSCVSRDTFGFLPDEYELLGYVARQSWISVENSAHGVTIGDLASDFQRRMTEGDVEGDALRRIHSKTDEIDLLLLDLCDERLGIVEFDDETVVTRSVEKIGNGSQAALDARGRPLRLGDDAHVQRWRDSAESIRARLEAWGMLEKTLVLAPEWAMFDDEASLTPTSFGMRAGEMNTRYETYYESLALLEFRVLKVGPTLAGSGHKWGRAPFHFHESTYQELVNAIIRAHDAA
jgi:hypothetical protein